MSTLQTPPRVEKVGRESYLCYLHDAIYQFAMDPGPSQTWVLYADSLYRKHPSGLERLTLLEREGVFGALLPFLATKGFQVTVA